MTSFLLSKKLVTRFDRKEGRALHTHDDCEKIGLGKPAGVFVVPLRTGFHTADLSPFALGQDQTQMFFA
ncbi:hypothetical protein GIV32_25020 [Pseudomonas sp. PA-1-5A]|nr:hypothetical protein [Pseudomonas sp. PA-1-5A]